MLVARPVSSDARVIASPTSTWTASTFKLLVEHPPESWDDIDDETLKSHILGLPKMLAKLASGMNKPAQQTVIPAASVQQLLVPLPIKKINTKDTNGGSIGKLPDEIDPNMVNELPELISRKKFGNGCGLQCKLGHRNPVQAIERYSFPTKNTKHYPISYIYGSKTLPEGL
ncbi:DNA polymerase eta-like protein [Drosera capensis]